MMHENSPQDHHTAGLQRRKIYSVSELTEEIKTLFEDSFSFVWLFGEISNLRIPTSGHFYFTLKDSASQISAVMFRGQQRHLKFEPEDGMSVTGMGRLSVYEPRGTYQIILEYLEPSGIGALQIAFEKLKKRLAEEGLFDAEHKQPIPYLPENICIITSPSGAVIHDILKTIHRRFDNLRIQILPAKVQGHGAVEEIVASLELVNARIECDVVILARGGGSLEDLQAFNSEPVARAIFSSKIPVISAIGHETDYTISDFVADLRAPTPTAAAELAVPEKSQLQRLCSEARMRLHRNITYYFNGLRLILKETSKHLSDPRRKLADFRLRLDDFAARLGKTLILRLRREREYLNLWHDRFKANTPAAELHKTKQQLEQINSNLLKSLSLLIESKRTKTRELSAELGALNPHAILSRGYSITRTIPQAVVVKDSRNVAVAQELEVILAKGRLMCSVKGKLNENQKNI